MNPAPPPFEENKGAGAGFVLQVGKFVGFGITTTSGSLLIG